MNEMQQCENTFLQRKRLLQIFSICFRKGITKKGRAQTQICSETALCGHLLLEQHLTWQTCQTNHALQDINGHGAGSVSKALGDFRRNCPLELA